MFTEVMNSLIHALLYANGIDIEGNVQASSSVASDRSGAEAVTRRVPGERGARMTA